VKRIIDLVAALLALLILSPVLALVALLSRIHLGKPVFFLQQRPGLYGVPFNLLKFRTMKDAVDAKGNSLPDADRLTRYGKFLSMNYPVCGTS